MGLPNVNYPEVAAHVMSMCKKIDPNFYSPSTNPDMVKAWAMVLATKNYPPQLYYQAVLKFYADDTEGRRPSVGQIIGLARHIAESDREWRFRMKEVREQLTADRDRELAAYAARRELAATEEVRAISGSPDGGDEGLSHADFSSMLNR